MYRGRTSARLAAWREYPHRNLSGDGPLPPNWFWRLDEATMVRSVNKWGGREAKLHYGDGIGGDGEKSRPGLRIRRSVDVLPNSHAYPGEYWVDDQGYSAFRGVVARLPHGRGFLAGVEWGEVQSIRKGTWAMGGGWLDCTTVHGDERDAAIDASESARIECEHAQEDEAKLREDEAEAERLAELAASSASGND